MVQGIFGWGRGRKAGIGWVRRLTGAAGCGYLLSMITFTEQAATRIKELAAADSRGNAGLRIFVDKGGCSGLQYNMNVDEKHPGDETVDAHGTRIHLAAEAVPLLKGSEIDFEDSLTSTGFKIRNPNAKQTCGCGTSFEA